MNAAGIEAIRRALADVEKTLYNERAMYAAGFERGAPPFGAYEQILENEVEALRNALHEAQQS